MLGRLTKPQHDATFTRAAVPDPRQIYGTLIHASRVRKKGILEQGCGSKEKKQPQPKKKLSPFRCTCRSLHQTFTTRPFLRQRMRLHVLLRDPCGYVVVGGDEGTRDWTVNVSHLQLGRDERRRLGFVLLQAKKPPLCLPPPGTRNQVASGHTTPFRPVAARQRRCRDARVPSEHSQQQRSTRCEGRQDVD